MTEVLGRIGGRGVVPVVVIDDAARARGTGTALRDGGLPVIEVTLRTDAALAAIAALADDPDLLVGAGTVVTVRQVEQAVEAGARFVVSPGFRGDVVGRCADLGVPVLPGIATASEVMAALATGLHTVKFFPADVLGGVPAIEALAAPFPQVSFVPTGGIGPADVARYLAVPQVVAVGGSWVASRRAISAGDFATIAAQAGAAAALVRSVRG